jgi:nucleoside-diphosphate-sugar epimerase
MARCLVTGGAGFIGSHLVEALVAFGHRVRVIDNLSTGDVENLAAVADAIELIHGDVTDASAMRAACKEMEYVFHLAALGSIALGVVDPIAVHHAGATGTLQALLAAREAQARRFIYAASSSAYGNASVPPLEETFVTQPLSTTAVAKLAGEEYCVAFHHIHGLETVRLRYFSVFGPRQMLGDTYAAVIPHFIAAALKGGHPIIHGDGLQSRDFTYVSDVVQANLLAMEAPRIAGRLYNIASGRQTTLIEILDLLGGVLGIPIKPIHDNARPGDVRHSHADISRAQTELGYCPCTVLRLNLAQCADFYRTKLAAPASRDVVASDSAAQAG